MTEKVSCKSPWRRLYEGLKLVRSAFSFKFVKFSEHLKILKKKLIAKETEMQLKDAEFNEESDEFSLKDRIQVKTREKNEKKEIL